MSQNSSSRKKARSQNSRPQPEKRLGHKTRDPNLEKRLGHKTRDPKKGSVTKLATPTSKKGSVTKGHKTRTLIRGKEGRFRFPFLSNFFTFSHGISCRDQSRLSIARPARRSSRSPRARGIAKGRRCAACTVTKNLSFQKRDSTILPNVTRNPDPKVSTLAWLISGGPVPQPG